MRKTVFITGANRGIGKALAHHYHAMGWHILAASRQPDPAQYENLENLDLLALDVADEQQISQLTDLTQNYSIDLLINNAGITGADIPLQALNGPGSTSAWIDAFRVNAIGPLRIVEALMPALLRSADRKVTNISSIVSCLTQPVMGGLYQYRSTKAALNAITVGLAQDLKDQGVTVISLHPGLVKTDMGGDYASTSPEQAAQNIERVISDLTLEDSGRFFNAEGGELLW